MSVEDRVNYYLSLVPSQHRDKEKFIATLKAILEPICYTQELIASLPEKFDLDTAIGKQLDIVGEWVGRTRRVSIPITGVYFTWDDTIQTGWDSGLWKGDFDPDSGLTSLNDDDYRLLLRAKIAANHWDGTIPGAYAIWQAVFTDSIIIIEDHQDMSYVVGIAGKILTPVQQSLLLGGYIPLKPEGVRVNYYAISVTEGPLFGWDIENDAISGWEEGSWPLELIPT